MSHLARARCQIFRSSKFSAKSTFRLFTFHLQLFTNALAARSAERIRLNYRTTVFPPLQTPRLRENQSLVG